jgi:hypothetical protein
MPGATGVTISVARSDLASGYVPKVGDWLCITGARYELAGTDTEAKARVIGAVYEVVGPTTRVVLIGSFVPLKTFGTVAELQALTTPVAFLAANGRAGDRPAGAYSRRLFTVPIPVGNLTASLLESLYVFVECDTASFTPAP